MQGEGEPGWNRPSPCSEEARTVEVDVHSMAPAKLGDAADGWRCVGAHLCLLGKGTHLLSSFCVPALCQIGSIASLNLQDNLMRAFGSRLPEPDLLLAPGFWRNLYDIDAAFIIRRLSQG